MYLPQNWFTEEYALRREKCQILEGLEFRTKVQIAQELIQGVTERGLFRPQWVGCDCTFGSSWGFLDEVGRDYWYFANVKSNTLVWEDQLRMRVPRYHGRGKRPRKPRVVSGGPVTVAKVASDPGLDWRWATLAEGAKGPIMAERD